MITSAVLRAAAPYAVGALLVGLLASHWWAYRAGVSAEEQRQARADAVDLATAVNRAIAIAGDVVEIGSALTTALRASRQREERAVQQVEEIFDADPAATDFGALRRPAELERLRRAQLEAIGRGSKTDRL